MNNRPRAVRMSSFRCSLLRDARSGIKLDDATKISMRSFMPVIDAGLLVYDERDESYYLSEEGEKQEKSFREHINLDVEHQTEERALRVFQMFETALKKKKVGLIKKR